MKTRNYISQCGTLVGGVMATRCMSIICVGGVDSCAYSISDNCTTDTKSRTGQCSGAAFFVPAYTVIY